MGTVFKVGDRVVVVEPIYDYNYDDENEDYVGSGGTVSGISEPEFGQNTVGVMLDGLPPRELWFFEDELELVTDDQES